jgi:hypothetical protein
MDCPNTQLRSSGPGDIKALLRQPPPAPPVKGTQFTSDGVKTFPSKDSDKDGKSQTTKRRLPRIPLLDVDVSGFTQNPTRPNIRSEDSRKHLKSRDKDLRVNNLLTTCILVPAVQLITPINRHTLQSNPQNLTLLRRELVPHRAPSHPLVYVMQKEACHRITAC